MKSKISCNLCMDLIPLVKGHAASEESTNAVLQHIKTCPSCLCVYEGKNNSHQIEKNLDHHFDTKSLKIRLRLGATSLLVMGLLLGVVLTGTSGLFYNVLIMPAVGALAMYAVPRRYLVALPVVFVVSYVGQIVSYVVNNGSFQLYYLWGPIGLSVVCLALCAVGMLIFYLLKYAFTPISEENCYETK